MTKEQLERELAYLTGEAEILSDAFRKMGATRVSETIDALIGAANRRGVWVDLGPTMSQKRERALEALREMLDDPNTPDEG